MPDSWADEPWPDEPGRAAPSFDELPAAAGRAADSGLHSATEVLERIFGYDSFRGAQQEIIEHVIGGGDALVLMPTGGGKSLCYQVPALVRPGTGVVISPLIALMQDQVDALQALGVRAGFLNSTPGRRPPGAGRTRARPGRARRARAHPPTNRASARRARERARVLPRAEV